MADFGLSKLVDKKYEGKNLKHTRCGTLAYMPPEALDDKGYSEKYDIWAAGVVLYQMLFGRAPSVEKLADGIWMNYFGTLAWSKMK